jgi:hypothetical protein
MSNNTKLVGYASLDPNRDVVKIAISRDGFNSVTPYKVQDGTEYVGMMINLNKLRELIGQEIEVTAVSAEQEGK